MNVARRWVRTALWWLRPRNPQIRTYFSDRIIEPRKGRPSDAFLRELRERRQKTAQR